MVGCNTTNQIVAHAHIFSPLTMMYNFLRSWREVTTTSNKLYGQFSNHEVNLLLPLAKELIQTAHFISGCI